MSEKTRLLVGLLGCLLWLLQGAGYGTLARPPARVQARAAMGNPVTVVGHVGGVAKAVAVQGTYAYLGLGSQFVILDVADPTQPRRVGALVLAGLVRGISLHAATAYVAAGSAGLYQLDISDPTQPRIVAHRFTPDARAVARHGETLYLATGDGLLIMEPDNAGGFRLVGTFPTAEPAWAIALQGTYVFVTERGGGPPHDPLHILNVQEPAHPVEVGALETSAWIQDIALAGHRAYLTITIPGKDSHSYLSTVDLTDVTIPHLQPDPISLGGTDNAKVAFNEGRIYTLVAYGLLTIFEPGPERPVRVGGFSGSYVGEGLAIQGGLAYLAAGPRGLTIAQVADPRATSQLGRYITGGYVVDVAVQDGYLYLADRGDYLARRLAFVAGNLKVVDATEPTRPQVVREGSISPDGLPRSMGSVLGVTISDGQLYAAGGVCDEDLGPCEFNVQSLDITLPSTPTLLSSYRSAYDMRRPNRIAATHGYLFIAAPTFLFSGVDIFPVPALDTRLHYDLLRATDIALAYPYAYVVSRDGAGLRILDIAAPMAVTEVAAFMPTGSFEGVTVAGGHVFLAGGDAGVTLVDVTNPTSPTLISHYDTPGSARDVAVYGSLAFVADGWTRGVSILDISSPTQPLLVASYATPGEAVTLAADERFVYVADSEAGLYILQVGTLVQGQVLEATGAPVTGVTIRAGSVPSVTTGADGAFAMGHILSDTFTVRAEQPGYGFVPATYTVTAGVEMPTLHFTRVVIPTSTTLEPGVASQLTYTDTQGLPTTLAFPPDAVTATTTLWLTPTLVANYGTVDFANHAFDLGPDLTFAAPVTITLRYSDADVAQVMNEGTLWLGWWNGTDWQDATTTCAPATPPTRDMEANTLTLEICRTGRFALFGPTSQHWLPLLGVGASGG